MIPKIIHQTSKSLSWEEKYLTSKSKRLMPDYDFKMWSDEDNHNLVKKYFPQYVGDYENLWHGVIRADIARCLYLYEYGGIYCDTDYKFFNPPSESFLKSSLVLGVEDEANAAINAVKYGNAFFASEKGFSLWLPFLESAFERLRNGEKNILYIAGPHALSLFLAQHPEYLQGALVYPQEDIYPDFRLFRTDFIRRGGAVGGHLCWGGWRNKPILQKIKCRLRRVLSAII